MQEGWGLAVSMNEATDGRGASRARKKKTMKSTSQNILNSLPQDSEPSQLPARKHDAELAAARLNPAWIEFEASIYTNDFLRARITLNPGSTPASYAYPFADPSYTGRASRIGTGLAKLTSVPQPSEQWFMTDISLDQGTWVSLPSGVNPSSYYPANASGYAINPTCVHGKARTWGQFDGSVRSSTTNGLPDL